MKCIKLKNCPYDWEVDDDGELLLLGDKLKVCQKPRGSVLIDFGF